MRSIPRLRPVLLSLLLGCFGTLAAASGSWVSPTDFQDPEAKWANEGRAGDADPVSYASDRSNRAGFGAWLECRFAAPVTTDLLRVRSDFGFDIVDAVDIDALVGGSWVDIYDGSVVNAEDDLLNIATTTTDAFRFRYHYLRKGYYFWLYDFRAFALPEMGSPPVVETLAARSITDSSAVIGGLVTDNGGLTTTMTIHYGTDSSLGQTAVVAEALDSGDGRSVRLTGLNAGVTIFAQAVASNSAGSHTGEIITLTTGLQTQGPAFEWIGATGWQSADWLEAGAAVDDDPESSARFYHVLGTTEWSPYLTVDFPAVPANGLRFTAGTGQYVTGLQIDRWDGSQWLSLYDGDGSIGQSELDLPLQTLDRLRVRMRSAKNAGFFLEFFDLAVHAAQVPSVAITAPTDGTVITPAEELVLTADAADRDGQITAVRFLDTANGIDLDAALAPGGDIWTATWTDPTPGDYTIIAEAADDDGQVAVAPAVVVTVDDPTPPGSVSAGPDQTVSLDHPVIDLDGSLTNIDPAFIAVLWEVIDAPVDSVSDFDDDSALTTRLVVNTAGTYTCRLSVNASEGEFSDELTITVQPRPALLTSDAYRVIADGFQLQSSVLVPVDYERLTRPAMTPDGRFVVFCSDIDYVDAIGTQMFYHQTYLYDVQNDSYQMLSVAPDGSLGDGPSGMYLSISDDGETIVFLTEATNLEAGPTSPLLSLACYHRSAGVLEILQPFGEPDQILPFEAKISGDGSTIALVATAYDAVGTLLGDQSLFSWALGSNDEPVLLSVDSQGVPNNGPVYNIDIDQQGSLLAFETTATNLAALPLATGVDQTAYAVRAADGNLLALSQHDGAVAESIFPTVSDDGDRVFFNSPVPDFVAGVVDTDGTLDVFEFDLPTATRSYAALGIANAVPDGLDGPGYESADQSRLLWPSLGSGNVTADPVSSLERAIYVRDQATGERVCITHNILTDGVFVTAHSQQVISHDGDLALMYSQGTPDTDGAAFVQGDTTVTLVDLEQMPWEGRAFLAIGPEQMAIGQPARYLAQVDDLNRFFAGWEMLLAPGDWAVVSGTLGSGEIEIEFNDPGVYILRASAPSTDPSAETLERIFVIEVGLGSNI